MTAPANGTVFTIDASSPGSVNVSGTSNGTTGDQVRLWCFRGNSEGTVGGALNVAADGSFSATLPASDFAFNVHAPCVLRAVPAGSTPQAPPGSPSPFNGPTIESQGFSEDLNGGTVLEDFNFSNIGALGSFTMRSAGRCGVTQSTIWDPVTFALGDSGIDCGAGILNADGTFEPATGFANAMSSELKIDGHNAWLPAAVPDTATSGLLPVTWSHSVDPTTANATVTESDPAMFCSPDPDTFPPTPASCSSLVAAPVRLDRTTQQTNAGRLAVVRDRWVSLDGQSHALDLEMQNSASGLTPQGGTLSKDVAFLFPWVSPNFQVHHLGVVPGPPSAPAQVDVATSLAAADADMTHSRGVMVFSNAPSQERFVTDQSGPMTEDSSFVADYHVNVPGSGFAPLGFAYGDAFTQADVNALAATAVSQLKPVLSVNAPPLVFQKTKLTVGGKATDGQGLSSFTVNGLPTAVGGDGSWSVALRLKPGPNPLALSGTNVYGNSSEASATIQFAKLALSGKPKVSGGKVVFKLHCSADPSVTCPAQTALATKERLRGRKLLGVRSAKRGKAKVRTKKVAIAKLRHVRVKGGKTVIVKLSLNATGRKLLKRFHKLPARLTVTVVTSGGKLSAGGGKLTVRPAKKKHHKR